MHRGKCYKCTTVQCLIDNLLHRLLHARFKVDGEVVNFYIHYEIDDNKSKHVFTLTTYGGDETGSWVLLEALA